MKKVFLTSASSVDELDQSLISYSMALGFLAAYAEKAGWKPIAIDCYCTNWETTERTIKEIIERENPEVIGFNCITMNRMSTYKGVDFARKLNPKIKIIVGGVQPTIYPEHFLIHHNADVVVLNEGEETFEELLNKFAKNQPITKVKGIAYKDKNGKVVRTAPRKQICDLDSMPFMKHEYFLNQESKKAFIFSSRGCPNNCIFCSASAHWGRGYRARSPKNVVDEIEEILKKFPNIDELRFMDDTFTLNNQRVIEICKEMLRRNIKIKWRCSGRVFPISVEMIKWMEKAGCIMISFGIESGSPRLLKEMGKNQTVEQAYNAMKIVYENSNISPEMFMILGFPNESEETVNETIHLIKRIVEVAKEPLKLTAARILEIYPGTRLFDLAKKKGLITDEFWLKTSHTPLYQERSMKWLKKQRNRILWANWTHAGIFPVVRMFFQKQMYKPRKIYNILRPYLKGIN